MNAPAPARTFTAVPAIRGEEPLSIGMVGPPGGGKTCSALRVAGGMQEVRGGDIVLIDTEGGRARKYADQFKFNHVNFEPPHRPSDFLEAIKQQLRAKPAAIIVDSMSDEHEGQGGYLEWHDEEIPKFGGNDWAAWSKPKAARKRLITGLLQIKVPLIFTFRAREKTAQNPDKSAREKIINIGWQPVAPLEIVHAMDMTCILPPRAEGYPVWKSNKIGEGFIIKLPTQFKALFSGEDGRQLDEEIGRALATWAKGGAATSSPRPSSRTDSAADQAVPSTPSGGTAAAPTWQDYSVRWDTLIANATKPSELKHWNDEKPTRNEITWPSDAERKALEQRVRKAVEFLSAQ